MHKYIAMLNQCIRETLFKRNPKYIAYLLWKYADGDNTKRIDYPLDKNSIVFDVGGYRGEWAKKIYERYGCNVYVFEPIRQHVETINRSLGMFDKIEVISAGLGGYTRKELISLQEEASSIHSDTGSEQVDLIDICEIFDRYQLSNIDLMKINIEGGEYELLERMHNVGLMDKVTYYQIQFHDFVECASEKVNLIRKYLSETHTATYRYPFVWEGWSRNDQV